MDYVRSVLPAEVPEPESSMNDVEKYQFDLNGYLLLKGILDPDSVARCLAASNTLEDRIRSTIDDEPHFIGHYGLRYHYDEELGYCSYVTNHGGGGSQYIVDDILNADPAFDALVGHAATMKYVEELALGPLRISSSELRYRDRGNITGSHMGGPIDSRNQYQFVGGPFMDSESGGSTRRDFNLLTVRIMYALHDVPMENGPLCVVPGSHKANFHAPYGGKDPLKEPGMIGVPMQAGDAILFTENLRHGGFPNVLDRTRKTIHICFGPVWASSQSPAHWNDFVHVTEAAWARYSEAQRALLPPPSAGGTMVPGSDPSGVTVGTAQTIQRLRNEVAVLQERMAKLEDDLAYARRVTLCARIDDIVRRLRLLTNRHA